MVCALEIKTRMTSEDSEREETQVFKILTGNEK